MAKRPTLTEQRAAKIRELEVAGELDPECSTCKHDWYPFYRGAWKPDGSASEPWAPRHKSPCGHYEHCTCSRCF